MTKKKIRNKRKILQWVMLKDRKAKMAEAIKMSHGSMFGEAILGDMK